MNCVRDLLCNIHIQHGTIKNSYLARLLQKAPRALQVALCLP